MQNTNRNTLVFPKESFEIVGAAFRVFNNSGWGLSEKYYQKALSEELDHIGLEYRREVSIPLNYTGKNLGRYFADFIIKNKILLELKVVPRFNYVHCRQVVVYLKSANLRLGILIYFTKEGVKYRRILNPNTT